MDSTKAQKKKGKKIMKMYEVCLAKQHEIIRRVGLLFERADAFDQEVALRRAGDASGRRRRCWGRGSEGSYDVIFPRRK
jgi:hypothetical protein